MTVFVSDGNGEKEEHKIELELKPTAADNPAMRD
jgi:hypothetical protein